MISEFLTVRQTIDYIADKQKFSIENLSDLVRLNKLTPVFLVSNTSVMQILGDTSSMSIISGYCSSTDNKFFTDLMQVKKCQVSDMTVFRLFEQYADKTTNCKSVNLKEGDIVKVTPKYEAVHKYLDDEVIEENICDVCVDYIYVDIADIRFSTTQIKLLDSANQNALRSEHDGLGNQKRKTYQVIIGALHELLNSRLQKDKMAFHNKNQLVQELLSQYPKTDLLSKNTLDKTLKECTDVFEEHKKS